MNIFQKMSAVTNELQTVAKNLVVSTGKNNSYKAVSERDIIDAVKPLEIKHGIYSYPFDRQIIESQTLDSESEYNGKVTKKTTFFSRIKTTYRFVNVEKPDEYIDMVTFAEGIDPQDKGSGKAMTYADKYALMKAYKISTGDDPDQNASEETHYSSVRAGNAEQPRQQKTPRQMLIARLNELGIDVNAYAKANNLNGKTDPETFTRLLKELENA
jgi:hypothetical protein